MGMLSTRKVTVVNQAAIRPAQSMPAIAPRSIAAAAVNVAGRESALKHADLTGPSVAAAYTKSSLGKTLFAAGAAAAIATIATPAYADPTLITDYGYTALDIVSQHPMLTGLSSALAVRMLPINKTLRSGMIYASLVAGLGFQAGWKPAAEIVAAYMGGFKIGPWIANKLVPAKKEETLTINRMPWLRFEDRDGDLPKTTGEKIRIFAGETAWFAKKLPVAIKNKALGALREYGWLADPMRREVVSQANSSIAAISIYSLFRIGGTLAVFAAPNIDPISKMAAIALMLGEFWVRIPTSIGYQRGLIDGLNRTGDFYYHSGPEEETDNIYGASTSAVHYMATEKDVFERSAWGTFLIDRPDRHHIFGVARPDRTSEVMEAAAKMNNWILDILEDVVEPGQRDFIASRSENAPDWLATEQNNIIGRLDDIADRFAQLEQGWMTTSKAQEACAKPLSAINEYLAEQLGAYARRFLMMADEISAIEDPAVLEQEIENTYSWMANFFDYNLIPLFRAKSATVDTGLGYQLLSELNNAIPDLHLTADAANSVPVASQLKAFLVEAGINMALFDGITKKNITDPSHPVVARAIADGLTREDMAKELIIEYLNQTPIMVTMKNTSGTMHPSSPKVGGKCYQQNHVYRQLGRTLVFVTTRNKNSIEVKAQDWQDVSDFLFPQALKDQIADSVCRVLTAIGNEEFSEAVADKASARAIMQETARTFATTPAAQKTMRRDLIKIARTFIADTMTNKEMAAAMVEKILGKQAGISIEWEKMPDSEFNLSYDKDYVPRAIDLNTSEPMDLLRSGISYMRGLERSGRTNVFVTQSAQLYATRDYETNAIDANNDQKIWYGRIVRTANAAKNAVQQALLHRRLAGERSPVLPHINKGDEG